jgi:microcystin-dependent protein
MAQDTFMATVYMFAGNFAPRGYQFCQGQLLPISQYSALFALLGTTFGGNGQSNFALPDLRSRLPVGAGAGPGLPSVDPGQMGGTTSVSLTSGNMPSHTHGITITINAAADGRPGGNSPANSFLDSGTPIYTGATDGTTMNPGMATGAVAPTGGNQPINVQNPYLGINFIIATEGIFPSRN